MSLSISASRTAQLFSVFLLWTSLAQAADPAGLRVGLMHFPPFSDISEEGNPKGLFRDMIVQSLDRAGIPVSEVKGYPPKRHYSFLGSGQTELSIGAKDVPAYHEKVLYSSFPVYTVRARVFSLADGSLPPENPRDWQGRFILLAGYTYSGLRASLEEMEKAGQVEVVEAPSHDSQFKMLAAGRGDCVLSYAGPAQEALERSPIPDIQQQDVFVVEVFFLVNKDVPHAQEVLTRVERAFEELKNQGAFEP